MKGAPPTRRKPYGTVHQLTLTQSHGPAPSHPFHRRQRDPRTAGSPAGPDTAGYAEHRNLYPSQHHTRPGNAKNAEGMSGVFCI